jgi:hypothetical protein
MIDKDQDNIDSELELLRGILSEVQDLNSQLARTDERTQQNSSEVKNLRENRVSPLENEVGSVADRSRRNSIILGAGLTVLTIMMGAGTTYIMTIL